MSPATEKTVNGKTILEVPCVALRETVLENSPNPEDPFNPVDHFIEKEEIENALHLWDGELVTLFHPSQRHDLKAQNEAERKRKAAVGRFHEPWMDADKMKGVMRFDVDQLENARFGSTVLNDAREGRKIECSTGYLADYREAPPSAQYNGKPYTYTQHNIRPDHIAVIPFGTGKCSVQDGCGLNQNVQITNILETGRVPEFEDTTSRDWSRENLGDAVDGFLENADTDLTGEDLNRDSWSDNPEEFRSWASQKSILGSSDEDTYQRGTLWQVVHYGDEALNENALDAVISGRGEETQGISEQTKTAGQGIARNLLEDPDLFDRDLPDETENITIRKSFIQRLPELFSDFVENEFKPFIQTAIQGSKPMGLKSKCRRKIINALQEKPFIPYGVDEWADLEDEQLVRNAVEAGLNLPDRVFNQIEINNGENLGSTIEDIYDSILEADNDFDSFSDIDDHVAGFTEIAADTIENIRNPQPPPVGIECPPRMRLENIASGLADITDRSADSIESDLVSAAESDGCEFDEETENALVDSDNPAGLDLVEAAIEVYQEAGGNLSNSVLAFLEWIQTRSEAEAQEVQEIKDVLEEFTLLTEHEFLGRADVRDLRAFIQDQMSENQKDPSSQQEGGSFLSELSDDQKEALSALEPETIQALGQIETENIEQLNALLNDAASERERLTGKLVENGDAPFDDESELQDLSLNKLRKLDSAFSESSEDPEGNRDPSFVGANGGGNKFQENTENGEPDFESVSSTPVLTGEADS